MKITSLLITALASVALAKDDQPKNKPNNNLSADQQQCQRIRDLNKAVDIVANKTKIEQITQKNPQRAQRIKDDAAKAGPELSSFNKNATLTKYCGEYNANEKVRKQCRQIKKLDQIQKNLKNNTAVEEASKKRNESKDDVKKHWQREIDEINNLKKNKTLEDSCKKIKDDKDQNQKSAAATVKVAGTGAFALGLSLLLAALMQ